MVKHCRFYYGNEPAEGGGNFTLQAGVEPSQAILRFPLRATFDQVSQMTLTDGSITSVWPFCRIVRSVVTQGTTGGRWREVTVHDRRWAWGEGYHAVYGQYNRTNAAYGISNQRSARQLAALLLLAMGETQYDISALPTYLPGPSVDWDAANPASELQRLCEAHGCLVTLTPNNTVVIYPEGYGQFPRPDQRQMDFTSAFERPIIPRALVYEGGSTQIQHDLTLKPVGLEVSGANAGQYVNIDDLSYKPAGGWENEDPANFFGVDANYRKLAKTHVWKRYSIAGPVQLPIPSQAISNKVQGGKLTAQATAQQLSYFKITRGQEWRILPLNDHQNPTYWAGGPGKGEDHAVLGYFATKGIANTNTAGETDSTALPARATDPDLWIADPNTALSRQLQYPHPFTVEYEAGHVLFENPVFFQDANLGKVPAVIRLRTSFPVRDPSTTAFVCQQFWRNQSQPNAVTIAKIIKQPDVFYYYDRYGDDNETQFLSYALGALNRELYQYNIGVGYSAPYKGFVFDKPPDGVIRAVVYDVAENGGGTTHIDYNMERPEAYFTLREARNRREVTYIGWLQDQENRKFYRRTGKQRK